jgi:hypothetical protein
MVITLPAPAEAGAVEAPGPVVAGAVVGLLPELQAAANIKLTPSMLRVLSLM